MNKVTIKKRIDGLVNVYDNTCKIVSNVLESNNFPLVLSGDHACAGGTIAGIKKAYQLPESLQRGWVLNVDENDDEIYGKAWQLTKQINTKIEPFLIGIKKFVNIDSSPLINTIKTKGIEIT